jgi:hypothetical protein
MPIKSSYTAAPDSAATPPDLQGSTVTDNILMAWLDRLLPNNEDGDD